MTRPQFKMDFSLGHILTLVPMMIVVGMAWQDNKSDGEARGTRIDTVEKATQQRLEAIESTANSRYVRGRERFAAIEAVQQAAENRAARFEERMSAQQQSLTRIERGLEALGGYVRKMNGDEK